MTRFVFSTVAFLDILGWAEYAKLAQDDAETRKRMYDALSDIKEFQKDTAKRAHEGLKLTTFSDCAVLSVQLEGAHWIGPLFLCWAAVSISQIFLRQGFLVRGGITNGPLYHDDETVFGPGLNRAYQLESELAVYPRIILDPDVEPYSLAVNALLFGADNSDNKDMPPKPVARNRLALVGGDGIGFLNTLISITDLIELFEESNISPKLDTQYLKTVRPIVIRGLNVNRGKPNRYAKHEWMANHFNQVIADYGATDIKPVKLPLTELNGSFQHCSADLKVWPNATSELAIRFI